MRLLVVSDIHSNLDALSAVLADAGPRDAVVCAGDVTGYGAHPAECVDAVRSLGAYTVAGNHDHAIATVETDWFNDDAQEAIRINRAMLSEADLEWLCGLPPELYLEAGGRKLAVFHGSPTEPLTSYVPPAEMEAYAHLYLGHTDSDLVILGHTHFPHAVRRPAGVVLNPGSVGQPRDGDPRASYAVVDLPALDVEIRRVKYDIEAAAAAIEAAGIPLRFARRLREGR